MGLILTATAGLCLWIVLWATDIFGGFDAILFGIVLVLVAILARNLIPYLPGRRG
jgi:integral membrane sensor domain MASE1